MKGHSYIGLGFVVGVWAGGMLAGVAVIALDTAYSVLLSQGFGSALPERMHVQPGLALGLLIAGALVGGVTGAAFGSKYTPHGAL